MASSYVLTPPLAMTGMPTAWKTIINETFLVWIRDVFFTQRLSLLGRKTHLKSRLLTSKGSGRAAGA